MPSKLPNEILIRIFQQLHPVDQLECTLVCRRWNKLLEDYVLYQTVFIFSAVRLKKLLHKIQQRSDIANKIQRVAIHMSDMTPEGEEEAYSNSKKLLSLTPNLKILHRNTPTILENKTQYPWYNKIEYISEDAGDEITDYFLSSNACPNLKTFRYFCVREYHPLLKNASGLTSLILTEVKMGFNDLEAIHKHLPYLKSINLSLLYYKGGTIFSGKEITPATSLIEFVTHVDCEDVDPNHPELHAELLVYISRKYPNLYTLEYKYCGSNRIRSSEVDEIIKMGWNPLLQRLGPRLKKVSVYLPHEDKQLIETFDRFDCQLNYLDLHCGHRQGIEKMAQSKQAFYIQTLVLYATYPALDWLKSFRVLKSLELTYNRNYFLPDKVQLGDILDNSPPTLESLLLRGPAFDIDPNYAGTSNIKTLTFQSMTFDDKVDGFISRCFPQLSKLELRRCELQNNTLNLEKTDLVNFCYYNDKPFHFRNYRDTILVTTLKDNKHHSYVLHDKQYGLKEVFYPQNYRPFKSYPASDINDPKPSLNFICNSVKNVVFTA